MFPSKMAFVVNVPVSTKDLRRALESVDQTLTNESMFKAKYEMKAMLEKEMPAILEKVAERLRSRATAPEV